MKKNQFSQFLDGSAQGLQQESDLKGERTRISKLSLPFRPPPRKGENRKKDLRKGWGVGTLSIVTGTGNIIT